MFRTKRTKLIRQQLERRALPQPWWPTVEFAVARCERGEPREPVLSGAGPIPARSLVALLGIEPLVDGGIDWTQDDDLTSPGNAFYPPNNDVTMPSSHEGKLILQEWFFPTGVSVAAQAGARHRSRDLDWARVRE